MRPKELSDMISRSGAAWEGTMTDTDDADADNFYKEFSKHLAQIPRKSIATRPSRLRRAGQQMPPEGAKPL